MLRNFPVDIFTHIYTRGYTHTPSFLIYTAPRRATVFLLCGPTHSLQQKRYVSERHACKYRSNTAYRPHLTGHDRTAAVLVGRYVPFSLRKGGRTRRRSDEYVTTAVTTLQLFRKETLCLLRSRLLFNILLLFRDQQLLL